MKFFLFLVALTASAQTSSIIDMTLGTSRGNPSSGKIRIWANTASGNMECLTSGGASCFPSGSMSGPGSSTNLSIPAFNGTGGSTLLDPARLIFSGATNGTLTLYDSTATTGSTSLILRAGASQTPAAGKLLLRGYDASNTEHWNIDAEGNYNGDAYIVQTNVDMDAGGVLGGVHMANNMCSSWSSTAVFSGTIDMGICRNAAGVAEINTGTAGALGDLTFRSFNQTANDPTLGGNANQLRNGRITTNYSTINSNPGFTDQNGLEIYTTLLMGQAMNGAGTTAKTTILPIYNVSMFYGSGQRFSSGTIMTCNGMSDCATETNAVHFAGGPVNGDEGIGFSVVSRVEQQTQLGLSNTISTITKNTCNTTTTQTITASKDPQTVTVSSSTGCAGWVVIGRTGATGSLSSEAVNVTTGSGTITGVFRANHSSGVTVLPAVLLTFSSQNAAYWGQDRVVVNLTATPYTTGTVASITGGGFTGSGTTWTNTMVGGDATNPGCISLTNDNITTGPFTGGAGPLRSWYEITTVVSNTSLGIFTYSTAADGAYRGNGVGSGGYTIRPCARILYLPNANGSLSNTMVLDNNAFTWTAADSLEVAITPYPDVSGHQEEFDAWTPGGTYRSWWTLHNRGIQKLGNVFQADCDAFLGSGSCFGTVFAFNTSGTADYGVDFGTSHFTIAPIRLPSPASSSDKSNITWVSAPTDRYVGPTVDGSGADTFGLQLGWRNGVTENTLSTFAGDSFSTPNQLTAGFIIGPALGGSRDPFLELHESGTIGGGTETYFLIRGTDDSSWSLPSSTPASGFQSGWLFQVAKGNGGNPYSYFYGASASSGNNTGFVALQLTNATSNTTNSVSNGWWYQASDWDGSAAQGRVGYTNVEPGSGTNNAPLTYTVNVACSTNSWQSAIQHLCNPLSVRYDGLLQFGLHDEHNATSTRVTFDPTGLTADRTDTIPDVAGTVAIFTGNSTTGSTTQTYTNSPCTTSATTAQWIPVLVPGQTGTWYIPACH